MIFFQLFNWFKLFSSETKLLKIVGYNRNRSKITFLKRGLNGFSYFHWFYALTRIIPDKITCSVIVLGLQHSVILGSEPYGLPLNMTIMPQWLQKQGYRTHMVGKVDNSCPPTVTPCIDASVYSIATLAFGLIVCAFVILTSPVYMIDSDHRPDSNLRPKTQISIHRHHCLITWSDLKIFSNRFPFQILRSMANFRVRDWVWA